MLFMIAKTVRHCVFIVGMGITSLSFASDAPSVDGIADYREILDELRYEVSRIDVYYLSWYGTLSPEPTKESIPARADIVATIRDPISARSLLHRVARYVKGCSGPARDLDGVRLKIDIVGASGALLGSIISDGDLVQFESSSSNESFVVGCTTEMFRFIFSMGDPGFSGHIETHLRLREELGCVESEGEND